MYIRHGGMSCFLVLLSSSVAFAQHNDTDAVEIGLRNDAPSFSLEVDDTHVGYTADLCKRLAPVLARGMTGDPKGYTITGVETADRFEALRAGEIDLLCGVTTVTRERRAFMNFTIPVFEDGVTVAVSHAAPPELLAITGEEATQEDIIEQIAASEWTVGVLAETTTEAFLDDILLSKLPSDRVVYFDSHRDAFAALGEGELDAYFVSRGVGGGRAKLSGHQIVLRYTPLTYEPVAIGVARDHQDLLLLADTTLSDWIFDGTLEEIYERHFGPMTGQTREFFYKAALQ